MKRREKKKEQGWIKSCATTFWSAHAAENKVWPRGTVSHVVNSNKHFINTIIATDSKFQQHLNGENHQCWWWWVEWRGNTEYIPKKNENWKGKRWAGGIANRSHGLKKDPPPPKKKLKEGKIKHERKDRKTSNRRKEEVNECTWNQETEKISDNKGRGLLQNKPVDPKTPLKPCRGVG